LAQPALAGVKTFHIKAQDAGPAATEFARQADVQLVLSAAAARGKRTNAVNGAFDVGEGLELMLKGTGLRARRLAPGIYVVTQEARAPPVKPVAVPPGAPPELVTPSPIDALVVTGTRIRRANTAAAAPVTTLSQANLRLGGVLNLEEAINRLPEARADTTQFTNGSDADGRAQINLRNLGHQRTLILLDGERLAPVQAVDLNIIPAALVKRIDILTGGASTAYGSDAVAGVANFVLDRDFEGVRIDGGYSVYQHANDDVAVRGVAARFANVKTPAWRVTDGVRKDLTIAAGTRFAGGRGEVALFGAYRSQDPVQWKDRDFSACRIVAAETDGGPSCAVSTLYTHHGRFQPITGPSAGQVFYAGADGVFAPEADGDLYATNTRESFNFMRSDERRSAGAFVNFKVSEAAELHASLLYMKDATYSQFYPYINTADVPAGGFQINCRNPFLSASQAALLCGPAAGSSQLVSTAYTAIMSGPASRPLRAEAINQDYRISLGVGGEVFDHWRYDLSAIRSVVFSSLSDSNEIDPVRLNNALNVELVDGSPTCVAKLSGIDPACVPADIFRQNGLDPRFYAYAYRDYVWANHYGQTDLVANLSGDLTGYGAKSPWAGRGLAVALGLEYRADSLKQKIDAATLAFEQLSPPLRGRQSVYEIYGEMQAPIAEGRRGVERLEVNAGVRYSKYDTNDDLLATRKYELQYQPTRDWLVRASLNKAARAPNISELYTGSTYGVVGLSDPCSGASPTAGLVACQRTGVTAAQYGHIPDCPDHLCQTYGGNGNRSLRPENARTRTIGLVYTPRALPGFSLSADYYRIAVKGYIGPVLADNVFRNCLDKGGDYYCQFVHRAADTGGLFGNPVTGGYIAAGAQNTALLINEGVDVQASYDLSLGALGRLGFDLTGVRLVTTGGKSAPDDPLRNCAGYFGPPQCYAPQPLWRHNLGVTWRPPWREAVVALTWRHIGPTRLAANSADPTISAGATPYAYGPFTRLEAYDYIDLGVSVRLRPGLTVRLVANNLFDRTPPVVPSTFVDGTTNNPNTYTGTYDPLGRDLHLAFSLGF
jgi:outer membrane receptor protein involved in Fe transport